jgi:hypothetical protein
MDSSAPRKPSFPSRRNTYGHLRATEIFTLVLLGLTQLNLVHGESGIRPSAGLAPEAIVASCKEPNSPRAVKDALHLVCATDSSGSESVREAIVICFLGGFVKASDVKHPEVWFARYLHDRYGPAVQVWIFGNRDEEKAVKKTLQLVAADRMHGGKTTEQPAIIVYGHSWGGSQVLSFARDLGKEGLLVSLTIQIDSVRKLGHDGHTVPQNVLKAINFYQTRGLTPGERHIVPADPARTVILGNRQMTYDHLRINCSNYKWLSRMFNKPHHQIENDPRVWDSIASLIHAELTVR